MFLHKSAGRLPAKSATGVRTVTCSAEWCEWTIERFSILFTGFTVYVSQEFMWPCFKQVLRGKASKICSLIFDLSTLVPLAVGVHLFPSRTQQLSPPAPMVVALKGCESRPVPGLRDRIINQYQKNPQRYAGFFAYAILILTLLRG